MRTTQNPPAFTGGLHFEVLYMNTIGELQNQSFSTEGRADSTWQLVALVRMVLEGENPGLDPVPSSRVQDDMFN